ncbi:hypothetical protein E2C01_031553 [Portunus trituberculatus]|uniref:Uncharacterized protein n=1 Tax=Portunus trituberculatus TaxID=210409 RepID=A0A5B7EYV9_PORTR|nr:hypothetical protein [Portunus trituberculatus]
MSSSSDDAEAVVAILLAYQKAAPPTAAPLSAACAPPLYLRSWPRPRTIDAGVRRAGRREGLVRAARLGEEEAAVFRAHLHPYRATDERRKFPSAALNRSLARSPRRLVGSPLGVRRGSAAVSEEAICRSHLSLAET